MISNFKQEDTTRHQHFTMAVKLLFILALFFRLFTSGKEERFPLLVSSIIFSLLVVMQWIIKSDTKKKSIY